MKCIDHHEFSFIRRCALILTMFVIFATPSHAETFEDMISQMRGKWDDIENYLTLFDGSTTPSLPGYYISFITPNRYPDRSSKYEPIFTMSYQKSMMNVNVPTFPEEVIFNADGSTYKFEGISYKNSKTDYNTTSLFQQVWVTIRPNEREMEMLRQISRAQVVKVRYRDNNQIYDDRIHADQLAALNRMINFYDAYQNNWQGSSYGESYVNEDYERFPHDFVDIFIKQAEEAIGKKKYHSESAAVEFKSVYDTDTLIRTYHINNDYVVQEVYVEGEKLGVCRLLIRGLEKLSTIQDQFKKLGEPDEKEGDKWRYAYVEGDWAEILILTVKNGIIQQVQYISFWDENEPSASNEALKFIDSNNSQAVASGSAEIGNDSGDGADDQKQAKPSTIPVIYVVYICFAVAGIIAVLLMVIKLRSTILIDGARAINKSTGVDHAGTILINAPHPSVTNDTEREDHRVIGEQKKDNESYSTTREKDIGAHHKKRVRYRCPKCHHELEAGSTQCPGCGVRLKPRTAQN